MEISILRIFADNRSWAIIIVGLSAFIRALPELLSGPFPVGFDLLAGYAPSILVLPETYPLKLFGWLWSPLSVFVLWLAWKLSTLDLLTLLKFAGPVFYGLFVLSFYYLLSKGLGWNRKKSFFTTLLFLLQPAVLRIGWDQLRLMLGFVFLFALLARTKCDIISGAKEKPVLVIALSILLVLSQQLTAILFLVMTAWQLIKTFFKQRKLISNKILLVLAPSIIILISQVYLSYFAEAGFSSHFAPIYLPSGSNFFAFTNYFINDPRFVGESILTIWAYVGNLSLYVVIPLIPLVVKGFFKDNTFFPALIWLLIASFSIVVFPWFALSYYWFWIFLLPIPLTVYAGQGLDRVGAFHRKNLTKLLGGFLLLGTVGFGYATSLVSIGYPLAYTYMPPGLVSSCVKFENIPRIKEAFAWTNTHLPADAVVVVPENFQGFSVLYSRSDLNIRVAPPLLSFNEAVKLIKIKPNVVYAIYLKDDVEIDGIEMLSEFGSVGIFRTMP
jgi:hypothetical protein